MEEYIQKAASEYINNLIEEKIDYTQIDYGETSYEAGRCDAISKLGKDIFKVGAEWRINSVWHDMNDEPNLKKLLLVEDIDGAYNLTYMTKIKKWEGFVKYEHYTRWAYVEDLLPRKK